VDWDGMRLIILTAMDPVNYPGELYGCDREWWVNFLYAHAYEAEDLPRWMDDISMGMLEHS